MQGRDTVTKAHLQQYIIHEPFPEYDKDSAPGNKPDELIHTKDSVKISKYIKNSKVVTEMIL